MSPRWLPIGLPPRFSGQNLQTMRRIPEDALPLLEEAWQRAPAPPALPLVLRQRYDRREIYRQFGIEFDQRQQHLLGGLSPQLNDGGYCIFITLDKTNFDSAYDYEDELFADRFRWVTRRDRSEDHPDYVALRTPDTRVSLFVRNTQREDFTYLGELKYQTHRQFTNEGRTQQEYVFTLKHTLPESLLLELSAPRTEAATTSRPARREQQATPRAERRRPRTFDEYKKAFSYAVGRMDRTVVPAHQHYQVRLTEFLGGRNTQVECERDNVDVRFTTEAKPFIGEIKVTQYLSQDEAFRSALGSGTVLRLHQM